MVPRWATLVLLTMICFIASPMFAGDQSPVQPSDLSAALLRVIAGGVPGDSVAVGTSCGVIWRGAAGESDVVTHQPVSAQQLFGIGSITKTFVAVVILQLAEEGKLDLNRTAVDILGPTALAGIPNVQHATLKQLMNHTSGIPSWEDDSRWIREARGAAFDPSRHWSKTDTLAYIRGASAVAEPGAVYHYSNTNYTILGLVVEKVTRHQLAAEIRRRILVPLGLHDTYMEGYESVPQNRLPHRYQYATAEFRATAGVSKYFPEVKPEMSASQPALIDVSRYQPETWAAGGMVATASDLVRFAIALRDGKLLKPGSMQLMMEWRPATSEQEVGRGLFRTRQAGDEHTIGHFGAVLGFSANMYWIEGADVAIVGLTNVGTVNIGAVRFETPQGESIRELALRFSEDRRRSGCKGFRLRNGSSGLSDSPKNADPP